MHESSTHCGSHVSPDHNFTRYSKLGNSRRSIHI
jgi:hypothetical protein